MSLARRCATRRHATSRRRRRRWAMRIGYVGEVGMGAARAHLHAAHVYELLHDAGPEYGIANVGYRAIDTLRMEKGYLYWSTGYHTPGHAMGSRARLAVNMQRKAPSCGRDRWCQRARRDTQAVHLHARGDGSSGQRRGDHCRRHGRGLHDQRQPWSHGRQAHRQRLPRSSSPIAPTS